MVGGVVAAKLNALENLRLGLFSKTGQLRKAVFLAGLL